MLLEDRFRRGTAARISRLTRVSQPLPFCSHTTPNEGQTGRRTTQHPKTSNYPLRNPFPMRSEGYRSWLLRTHNPQVAGSDPTGDSNDRHCDFDVRVLVASAFGDAGAKPEDLGHASDGEREPVR
jgi:hypothetical protein